MAAAQLLAAGGCGLLACMDSASVSSMRGLRRMSLTACSAWGGNDFTYPKGLINQFQELYAG